MTNQPTSQSQPFAKLTKPATSVYHKLTKRAIGLCAMFVLVDVQTKRFGGLPAPSKLAMYKVGKAVNPSLLGAMASANNVKAHYLKLASNSGVLHMQRASHKQRANLLAERARERWLIARDNAIFAALAAHVAAANNAITTSYSADLALAA